MFEKGEKVFVSVDGLKGFFGFFVREARDGGALVRHYEKNVTCPRGRVKSMSDWRKAYERQYA